MVTISTVIGRTGAVSTATVFQIMLFKYRRIIEHLQQFEKHTKLNKYFLPIVNNVTITILFKLVAHNHIKRRRQGLN